MTNMSKEMRLNIILLLFSALCFVYVIPRYITDMASRNDFDPQMFPKIAIAVVGISALGLIVMELAAKHKGLDKRKSEISSIGTVTGYVQSLLYVFLYILSVTFVGFYSSSFILAAIFFRKMSKKIYLMNLLLLVILFCLIWFFFERVMNVPLPAGLLI